VDYVVAFVGPRGAGKTLSMSYLAIRDMLAGRPVFANYDIHWNGHRSQPLDTADWLTLSSKLDGATICLAEIQLWADSRRTLTVMNRLLGYLTMQTRKRAMSFYYTIQEFSWLDARLRWLTDVLIFCQDVAPTPWGRQNKLERGTLINWLVYDLSGLISGKPYQLLGRLRLKAKPLWQAYDSYQTFEPWEGFSKVSVKADEYVIDARGQELMPQKPLTCIGDIIGPAVRQARRGRKRGKT